MRLVAVSGTQGSGKSTLIRRLVSDLVTLGKRCGIVVNEDGEEKYEDDFVISRDVTVKTLQGG
ncbi:MAG: hypothetical protein HY912_16890 [Desulfomonile tiedjei]|uniref:CobW/HypB/UreG nucleotide-binding domain-containing protein n=1 Tax=Desulfomonile tiedjei TaxID=2358 RepID=A0A9D6V8Z1_9BACT|nr:hypothetical protein [Desulfomonile tiedjei]